MGEDNKRPELAGLSLRGNRVRCPATWSVSGAADFCGELARLTGVEWLRAQYVL